MLSAHQPNGSGPSPGQLEELHDAVVIHGGVCEDRALKRRRACFTDGVSGSSAASILPLFRAPTCDSYLWRIHHHSAVTHEIRHGRENKSGTRGGLPGDHGEIWASIRPSEECA